MNDMTSVIEPKVDQLTADHLLGGPRTIRISGVTIRPGADQPVTIAYDGDDGLPWRPCKSMSRVLVKAWGPDANAYIGRSVTLYRDDKVKWGGLEVGGIRISHMSHIDRDLVLALTEKKGSKKPHMVKPLRAEESEPTVPLITPDGRLVQVKRRAWVAGVQKAVGAMQTAEDLTKWRGEMGPHFVVIVESGGGDAVKQAEAAIDARMGELTGGAE